MQQNFVPIAIRGKSYATFANDGTNIVDVVDEDFAQVDVLEDKRKKMSQEKKSKKKKKKGKKNK